MFVYIHTRTYKPNTPTQIGNMDGVQSGTYRTITNTTILTIKKCCI